MRLKLRLKSTTIDKTLKYASETWTLTKRERKQLNIFERKLYRRILGPVYEKENWRILTFIRRLLNYSSCSRYLVFLVIPLNRWVCLTTLLTTHVYKL